MIKRDKASFRDPAGYVFWQDEKVYRAVMPVFSNAFDRVRQHGAVADWIEKSILWPEQIVSLLPGMPQDTHVILEHPVLPFVSYPYEWPFPLLKDAALFHLDLQIDALNKQIMLNDASAFNIQFDGINPVFIDHLAFRPYVPGEFWQAHQQFFEQFINPLLLQADCKIPFQAWYRGNLNGIKTQDIAKLLPLSSKLKWRVFFHIILQAHFEKMQRSSVAKTTKKIALPQSGLLHLWQSLRSWIVKLEAGNSATHWQSYTTTNSYQEDDFNGKKHFITQAVTATHPDLVWDLGCNTGLFSQLALEAGAKRVIGFDNDHSALAIAYARAKKYKLMFTPLYMDINNPTASQGWAGLERLSLAERRKPDMLLALALVHHLAITANIPLNMIIDWILSLSPRGVIEFIPKTDPMVQMMLLQRPDIFIDYTVENFVALLTAKTNIRARQALGEKGRELFWYESC